MTFVEYIENLCKEHALVKHSSTECHFSNLASDFDSKLQRIMHYPCVGIDTDGFEVINESGTNKLSEIYNLYFLSHVRDHGSLAEKLSAFSTNRTILNDFLARFVRDRQAGNAVMADFLPAGAEATRIEFSDAALYGWAISVRIPVTLNYLNCNNNFNS